MKIFFSNSFKKKIKKIAKNDHQFKKYLTKQLLVFEQNHRHPSLRLHKLKGKRSEQLSIWIMKNQRALCIQNNDEFIFFDIVNHNQY